MPNDQAELVLQDEKIREYLAGLSKRHKQIADRDKAVIGILSAVVFRDIQRHFEREEGPDGRWKPWSKSYAAFMASIGKSGNKILQDTGRLRQGFTPTNVRATGDGIMWFNPVSYASQHDEGFGRIPQRKFMWLSDEAMSEIEEHVLTFLES